VLSVPHSSRKYSPVLCARRPPAWRMHTLFDTMIDNVRFVSNDEGKLKAVWQHFLDICLERCITVGETPLQLLTNMSSWVVATIRNVT
jgi:hypothetical protein